MPKKQKRQIAETLPLVAIELGSDSVRAIAAEKVGQDMLHILGYEESAKYSCVSRGTVVQTSSAGYMIKELLMLLANRIGLDELPAAFTLVGGESLQIVPIHAKRDLIRRQPLTATLMQKLRQECQEKLETKYPNIAVLDLFPSHFVIDGQTQENTPSPAQQGTMIEGHYTAFIGKQDIRQKIQDSFDRACRTIEYSFVRPDALLSAFAFEDPSVLNDGCAVLDLGAQTSTLSVYKGNQYLSTKMVPYGGYHLTEAICDWGIPFPIAERIKCEHGAATTDVLERRYMMKIKATDGSDIRLSNEQVTQRIAQHLEKMLAPLLKELNRFAERIRIVYITGGGSMLNGMMEFIQARTPIEVTYGSHATLLDRTTDDEFCSPRYASLVGALILGSDYRDAHPGKTIDPPTITGIDKITQQVLKLFTDQPNE